MAPQLCFSLTENLWQSLAAAVPYCMTVFLFILRQLPNYTLFFVHRFKVQIQNLY